MIRHAGPAKLAAFFGALVLHGALVVTLAPGGATEIEGADGGTEVRLGTAFADMAAGTLSAERPETAEVTTPETPERLETERAETVVAEVDPALAKQARPTQAPEVPPEASAAAPEPETPERIASVQALPATRADTPAQVLSAPPVPTAAEALQPPTMSAAVAAEAVESTTVTRSLRPKARSAELEVTHRQAKAAKPAPPPAAKPAARAKSAPGNAERNARAGEATGRSEAVARQSGTGGKQQAAGNAAASNYPGLVMRKLSRSGKPRVNARGTAVIAFSIAPNGGLSSVSLARSSGTAALDRAALQLVRAAGPFPKPPAGARRSFSVQIKGL